MDEMYLPYGGGDTGWKRRFEITIPILLLILVFFVLGWKLNWFAGIPLLGDIFGQPVTNILVIGEDNDIIRALDDYKTTIPSLNYFVLTDSEMANIRDASYLDNYNIFILTESVGSTPGELPSLFREYLSQKLSSNGKLIVFGIAGSIDPDDSSVLGWMTSLGSYIPVTCAYTICEKDIQAQSATQLIITDINHEVLREFGTTASFTEGASLEYTKVNVEASKIAQIEVTLGDQTSTSPAIVEASHGLGGKTFYFAYHPTRTPTIFKNVIEYIM